MENDNGVLPKWFTPADSITSRLWCDSREQSPAHMTLAQNGRSIMRLGKILSFTSSSDVGKWQHEEDVLRKHDMP